MLPTSFLPGRLAAVERRRLQQLSLGVVISAGLHIALIGSLRPLHYDAVAQRPQPAVSLRVVPARTAIAPPLADIGRPSNQTVSTPPAHRAPQASADTPALSYLSGFVASEFVAAEILAQRPVPAAELVIAYPDGPDEPARVSVSLTLFVDEKGEVVRVWPENSDAPERFIDAAMAAFRFAAFLPGQGASGAVKSKMQVEVTFDSSGR